MRSVYIQIKATLLWFIICYSRKVTTFDSVAASETARVSVACQSDFFKSATLYHKAIRSRPSPDWEPRFARN